jgi:hypothetical protein
MSTDLVPVRAATTSPGLLDAPRIVALQPRTLDILEAYLATR